MPALSDSARPSGAPVTIREISLEVRSGASDGAGNAVRRWSRRRGCLLRVRDADGHVGLGEASPLPDYSPDAFDDVHAALTDWRPHAIEASAAGLDAALTSLPQTLPAARFAAETAVLDLLARRAGRSYADELAALTGRRRPATSLRTAALLTLDLDADDGWGSTGERAARLLDLGFSTLKIKVGRPGLFDAEVSALRRLRRHLGDDVALRLDANRAWAHGGIETKLGALAELDVEFLEEPTEAPYLPDGETAVPLALDESLRLDPESVRRLVESGAYRVAVLKPLVLGGAVACLRLATRLRDAGLGAVASHGFDGPVALQATAALAAVLDGPSGRRWAQGVAPHAGLDAWPAAGGLWVHGANLEIPSDAVGLGLGVSSSGLSP